MLCSIIYGPAGFPDVEGRATAPDLSPNAGTRKGVYVRMSDVAGDQVERLERLRRMYQERIDAQDVEHPEICHCLGQPPGALAAAWRQSRRPPRRPSPMIGIFTARVPQWAQGRRDRSRNCSDCHGNVVDLWCSGRLVALGTGYGLNGDLWREHSWGVGQRWPGNRDHRIS